MLDVFRMFANIWLSISNMLDALVLNIGGISVSYLDVLIGFICIGMCVTFFWKGAHE